MRIKCSYASGQAASPLSALRWPRGPASMNCAPQASANSRARCRLQNGSLLLAIATLSKGSFCSGTIAQPGSICRRSPRAVSGGATSSAALTRPVFCECAAHAATVIQPRLCAISTAGSLHDSNTSSSRAIQSPRRGRCQSCCSTRCKPCCCCQRLCQCAGPLFCQPGRMRMLCGFIARKV